MTLEVTVMAGGKMKKKKSRETLRKWNTGYLLY